MAYIDIVSVCCQLIDIKVFKICFTISRTCKTNREQINMYSCHDKSTFDINILQSRNLVHNNDLTIGIDIEQSIQCMDVEV